MFEKCASYHLYIVKGSLADILLAKHFVLGAVKTFSYSIDLVLK